MQNPDLTRGLELVRQACDLDHLNMPQDALPLYKNAIQFFNRAIASTYTDNYDLEGFRSIIPLSIHNINSGGC